MKTPNDRLEHLAALTHKYLQASYRKRKDKKRLKKFLADCDYRWAHTLRVSQFGKIIAETENVDIELVVAACLLHDIAWFDTDGENSREHGKAGAAFIRPHLQKLEYNPWQVDNICYSVSSHVTVENPVTMEAKIVSDADNIDRFGPYRILQWCYSDINDYDKLVLKLNDRITRLENFRIDNPLFTQTGKQLFAEQLQLQILFFSEFVGEKKLTSLPRL